MGLVKYHIKAISVVIQAFKILKSFLSVEKNQFESF